MNKNLSNALKSNYNTPSKVPVKREPIPSTEYAASCTGHEVDGSDHHLRAGERLQSQPLVPRDVLVAETGAIDAIEVRVGAPVEPPRPGFPTGAKSTRIIKVDCAERLVFVIFQGVACDNKA